MFLAKQFKKFNAQLVKPHPKIFGASRLLEPRREGRKRGGGVKKGGIGERERRKEEELVIIFQTPHAAHFCQTVKMSI